MISATFGCRTEQGNANPIPETVVDMTSSFRSPLDVGLSMKCTQLSVGPLRILRPNAMTARVKFVRL